MKIIQILPALKEGGVETGTIDLSLSLKARGHEVIVISNGGPGVKLLDQNGICHLQWPVHKKNPWTIFRMSLKLARHIEKNSPDIIHARSRVPAWITYFAALKTRIIWITTCHGYYQTHFGSRVMGWADAVIVPSRTIEKHMREDFNVSENKIVLIPRGVDLQKYPFEPRKPLREPPRKPIIAMIGRLTPIKGHKDFLKALSLLKKEGGDFSAWIIGDNRAPDHYPDRYYEELIEMRDSLGLKNDAAFLGHQENIADLLKKIDLLVFPSTYPESFGRVVIEAQAAGVPVVASRLGGAQEIIEEGITGHLFQAGHPKEIKAAIQRVFSDDAETSRMIRAARLKVEKEFSKSQMVEKTEAVYLKLVRLKPDRLKLGGQKILIFKLSSLGDLILISPSIRAIRKHFPDGKITLMTDFESRQIVELCPYLDEILYIDKKAYWKNLPQIIKKLSSRAFDISVDFQNNRWTHLVGFLSRIPNRYGFQRKWGWPCLNHRAPSFQAKQPSPPVQHQFQILKLLGIRLENDHLEFWTTEKDKINAEKLLLESGIDISRPILGMNIGASWVTKRWPASHICEFARQIHTYAKWQLVLTGSSKERSFADEILLLSQYPLFSVVGKTTLRELGALIQRCSFFVSTDSAPLHIAGAFGTPTIALFGPTDAKRHLPPGEKTIFLQQKVDCGPCYRSYCNHDFICMKKIEPDLVIEKQKELLGRIF